MLEKARCAIERYPSKADDVHNKPKTRLAQYFITKKLNKLNAFVELSDNQVAALNLRLPSHITSNVYNYSDPYASITYRKDTGESRDNEAVQDKKFAQQNDKIDRLELQGEFGIEVDPDLEEMRDFEEDEKTVKVIVTTMVMCQSIRLKMLLMGENQLERLFHVFHCT